MKLAAVAALLLCVIAPGVLRAEGMLDGALAVRSASIDVGHGVLLLDARVQYPMNQRIRQALDGGVPLEFGLNVIISRPRRFWFGATLLNLQLRYELTYHAVSGRYVLQDEGDATQQSVPTLQDALTILGHVKRLPIMVRTQLRGDGPFTARVRASVRRGRMPDALRALVFWSDDWHRSSAWYTWKLVL